MSKDKKTRDSEPLMLWPGQSTLRTSAQVRLLSQLIFKQKVSMLNTSSTMKPRIRRLYGKTDPFTKLLETKSLLFHSQRPAYDDLHHLFEILKLNIDPP